MHFRVKAQQSVEPSNYNFFEYFRRTPDLVCIAGRDGYLRQVNPAVVQKLGYNEEELYSRHILSFVYEADRERTRAVRVRLMDGESLMNFQNRYVAKDGRLIWLEWTSVFIPSDDVVIAIAKDITARKDIEHQVQQEHRQYQGLASHLLHSMEHDRKFVATELHEELAQLVLALKMNVDWVRNEGSSNGASSRERLNKASLITDQLVSTIRRISFAMSPHMIDDLGLNATLEWHCREFTVLHGISCHYFTNCQTDQLSKSTQIDLFRITQAALDNVRKHSNARSATVRLEETDEDYLLTITDNGKGFDPGTVLRGLGLQILYNRALSLGGALDIHSSADKGTQVKLVRRKKLKLPF